MAKQKADAGGMPGEIEMIESYFAPLAANTPGSFGLTDDAAVISPSPGRDLVVTSDALIADVHFFADDAAGDIAWKALAVNVSDLAAKGAQPQAYTLAIAMPGDLGRGWIEAFAAGLAEAQQAFGIGLAGGDTTSSPERLMIAITAWGTVAEGAMVRRSGGGTGYAVYVSGTIGDAALGLLARRGDEALRAAGLGLAETEFLIHRYLRPQPRLALAPLLQTYAAAAMDISDGLLLDLDRLCRASAGAGAVIEASAVPLSAAVALVLKAMPDMQERLLTGGDDYEILAAVRPEGEAAFQKAASAAGVRVTRIGRLTDSGRVEVTGRDGQLLNFAKSGFEHFR